MNSKLLFILVLLFSVNLQAQIGGNKIGIRGPNTVPDGCKCLTFVSECSGEIVTNINVRVGYVWCDGYSSSRTLTVGESGQICGLEGTKGECPTVSLCIEGSDWEVCEIVDCEVRLKKTLSQYPRINGQLIGYGALSPGNSSAYKFCERIHTGDLNVAAGAEDILYCAGDEAILNIQGTTLSATSGYCLTVNILRNPKDEIPIVSATFNHSNINGSSVDITDLLSSLESEELYVIEMIVACCEENETTCTTNSRKFAYFRLLSPFSFTAMATDGAIPGPVSLPFTPATSPNGTILNNTFQIPPLTFDFAAYTLTLSDLVNSIGADIDYQLYETSCTPSTGDDTPTGPPGNLPGENGQAFPVIVFSPATGCDCYRLELQYDDGCLEEKTRSNYYFQVGPDCIPGIIQQGPPKLEKRVQGPSSNFKAKLRTNPVGEELIFDLLDGQSITSETITITVFDISGKVITSKLVSSALNQVSIPFNQIPGMYIYSIETDGEVFTNKFVKK